MILVASGVMYYAVQRALIQETDVVLADPTGADAALAAAIRSAGVAASSPKLRSRWDLAALNRSSSSAWR